MTNPVLQAQLEAGYGKLSVLEDVSLELHSGQRMGLVGPSGSGKSTLLLALLGLLPQRGGWVRGEVRLRGTNILALSGREARSWRGREIALVPQSSMSALNPALSLKTHLEQCWKAHRQGRHAAGLDATAQPLLQRVDLPGDAAFLRRRPGQISVGQAQRFTIALALLHRPSVVIADEPTSALDPVTQAEVIDLLRETCEEQGAALLFVSHDLLSVLRLCSTVAVLAQGRVAEHLAVHDIVSARSETLRRLLAALPIPAPLLLQCTQAAFPGKKAGFRMSEAVPVG